MAASGLMGSRPYVTPSELVPRMLAFCQSIMEELYCEATWVTQQELKDDKFERTSLEERLGRRLPEVMPAPKGYLEAPEAVLVSQKLDLVAAIGLELRQISDRRMEIYNDILENLRRGPAPGPSLPLLRGPVLHATGGRARPRPPQGRLLRPHGVSRGQSTEPLLGVTDPFQHPSALDVLGMASLRDDGPQSFAALRTEPLGLARR